MGLERALRKYREYFDQKIQQFGPEPKGVDYNGPEAQSVRFAQLVKILNPGRTFSVLDYGCGYGALLKYMQEQPWSFTYVGYDMLSSMVAAAQRAFPDNRTVTFTAAEAELEPCDYLIAGAIFNNKFDASDDEWREYTLNTLSRMNSLCTLGFSFNMLTIYSDADKMALRPDLYFADPRIYFDHCKRNYARDVALLHDYGLYDFTILVRKQL